MPRPSVKAVRLLARFGCISIGAVYCLVGVIALLNLMRVTHEEADEEGIMVFVMALPMGEVFLGLIAAGLLGYVIWRFYESITDPYEYGNDWKSIIVRLGIASTGLAYGSIAYAAFQELCGDDNVGERAQQEMVAEVLHWKLGPWLIGLAAVPILITAAAQFYYGATNKFTRRLNTESLSEDKENIVFWLGKIGYFARGVILLVICLFFIKAALHEDPREIGNTDTAFDFMGNGWAGHSFFVIVALGTISYGLFMFTFSRFYRFEVEREAKKRIPSKRPHKRKRR
jgi:hypothetical protein